ncbi:transketolase [bacterium]|nr:MAG: transketolase [bacterium]
MRTAFLEALLAVAEADPRVWLLTGDLGYSVLEPFMERFPDRFVNVGVAEQNMVGVAAGLALAGKVVFTYSIANFPTLRCLEQIRNDVCYHNLPVISVAVGGGLAYGSLGYSHHAVEDLAILRTLPNMAVVAPGDPYETRAAVKALIAHNGPGYLRLGKANEPKVHAEEPTLAPGEPLTLREGDQVTLVSTGGTLTLAMEAAEALAEKGVHAEVLSLPFVAPLPDKTVAELGLRTGRIVSVEEHGRGGLGAALAEGLCRSGSTATLTPLTLEGDPCGTAGGQEYLRERQGLTTERIVEAAQRLLAA